MNTGRLAAIVAILSTLGGAESRPFEDTFGRMIEAELVGHWGPDSRHVRIKRDGKLLTVEIDNFAGKHHPEIGRWIEEKPFELAALQSPATSGGGVVSGSKWRLKTGNATPIEMEFRGSGKFSKNRQVSKSGWWKTTGDNAIQFAWRRLPTHTFSIPFLGNRIYQCPATKAILTPIDRLPAPISKADFEGHVFVLASPHYGLGQWIPKPHTERLIAQFKKDGKVVIAGNEFGWSIVGGEITVTSRGAPCSFAPINTDTFGGNHHIVLWRIGPPATPR